MVVWRSVAREVDDSSSGGVVACTALGQLFSDRRGHERGEGDGEEEGAADDDLLNQHI